ncbi:MAG TPA: hypothetical protein VMT87_03230 [Vicinamibacteria bacterium]|nr:hypothetical protein [Vicinamibacteria bacterium]
MSLGGSPPGPERRDVLLGALAALLALALNAGYVSAHLGFVHRPKQVRESDHHHYIEMAEGEAGRQALAEAPPYLWRVLTPMAARLLTHAGLSVNAAFYLITNLSLFGFLLVLFLYLREVGFDRLLALGGLALVALMQGAVRWFEYQYWMSDPPCLFLVALAFWLVRREKHAALGLVSVVAALVRETYVVVYAHYFLYLWKRGSGVRATARTLAVSAAPVAILLLLRHAIVPNQPDDLVASFHENVAFRLRRLFDNQWYVLTVGTWGVLFPLLFLYPGRIWELSRRHFDQMAPALLVYASLAVSNNTERPLAYAVPALLPAALHNLRTFLGETGLPPFAVLLPAVALQAFFWWQTRLFELGMSIYQPANLAVAAAMLAFWVLCRLSLARTQGRAGARAEATRQ